ncbi:helix-turn-helix protein [anaerobic digester metagenome]
MDDVKFIGHDSVFAERLRGLMTENGTTQTILAGITGITRQAISQYMDGLIQPNIEKLHKIASHFQVSTDYLLGFSDVKSFDLDVKAISEKTGLSDYSVEMLISYNEKLGGAYLIPIVDYLIEQEFPLYFEEEENFLLNIEEHLNHVSANEDAFDKLSIDRKKLDDDYLEWKNNHTSLLNIIEDYFAATASDEKLYITGKTIKKEVDFKNTMQKNVTTKRVVEANKLVEQVFISEIGDVLKVLKKRYIETKPKIYSIDFE